MYYLVFEAKLQPRGIALDNIRKKLVAVDAWGPSLILLYTAWLKLGETH